MKALLILTFSFLICSFIAKGQSPYVERTVYYASGKTTVAGKKLREVLNILKGDSFLIVVQGNADSVGSYASNMRLSEKRAAFIKEWLVKNGVPEVRITIEGLGSSNPVATNKTRKGRGLNRRVDMLLTMAPIEATEINEPDRSGKTIQDLYAELKPLSDTFCITNNADTTLVTAKGSIVVIKANCFTPKPKCNCVTIIIDDVFDKADIIANNLSTSYKGVPLESGGMINIQAYCNSQKLDLIPGMDMVVMMPTDKINPNAGIFKGEWDKNADMQWSKDSASILSGFNAARMRECTRPFKDGNSDVRECAHYKFFFKGLFKTLGGVLSRVQRIMNESDRDCLKEAKKRKALEDTYNNLSPKEKRRVDSLATVWKVSPFKLAIAMNNCKEFFDLMQQYKVKDITGVVAAVEKELDKISSATVSNNNSNRDTAGVQARMRMINDLQYYIFNKTGTGWSNTDWMIKIPEADMVELSVMPPARSNFTDCKMAFVGKSTVLEGVERNGKYYFKGPKDYKAYLIFFEMRNGQSYFGIKAIVISKQEFIIDIKPSTAREMRAGMEEVEAKSR
jgi:hypothetical protein